MVRETGNRNSTVYRKRNGNHMTIRHRNMHVHMKRNVKRIRQRIRKRIMQRYPKRE